MKRAPHVKGHRFEPFFHRDYSFVLVVAERPGVLRPDCKPQWQMPEPEGGDLLMPYAEIMEVGVYSRRFKYGQKPVKVRELFYTDEQVYAIIRLRPGGFSLCDPEHEVQHLICAAVPHPVSGANQYHYRVISMQDTEVI